jgi:hypothetical protein
MIMKTVQILIVLAVINIFTGAKEVEDYVPTTTMLTEYYKRQTTLNIDLFLHQHGEIKYHDTVNLAP